MDPPGAVVTIAFPLELAEAKFCVSVDGVGYVEVGELIVMVAEDIVALVRLLVLMDDIVVIGEDEIILDELLLIIDDDDWKDVELTLVADTTAEDEGVRLVNDDETVVVVDSEKEVCDDATEVAATLEVAVETIIAPQTLEFVTWVP